MFKYVLSSIFVLFFSCSFYSFQGSLPAHIKTVVISPIINNTYEYNISTLIDEKFTNMMLRENIIDVVPYEIADSKLDIIIKSITDNPSVFTVDNGYEVVNERKILVQVELIWFDLINNKDIINKTISEWSTYNLSLDIGNDQLDNDLDGLIDSEDSD